jgi:putative PIN family toxin of toxin-antitoxin system
MNFSLDQNIDSGVEKGRACVNLWNVTRPGTPGRLIEAAKAGRLELVSSTPLLAELQGVLNRPKFTQQLARRGATVSDVFDGYAAMVLLVIPSAIIPTIARDPADDQVLATAHACGADLIVSGDSHLLDLKQFMGINIVTAASAIRRAGL